MVHQWCDDNAVGFWSRGFKGILCPAHPLAFDQGGISCPVNVESVVPCLSLSVLAVVYVFCISITPVLLLTMWSPLLRLVTASSGKITSLYGRLVHRCLAHNQTAEFSAVSQKNRFSYQPNDGPILHQNYHLGIQTKCRFWPNFVFRDTDQVAWAGKKRENTSRQPIRPLVYGMMLGAHQNR